MKIIILDTNLLLLPSQQKIDIFEEIERICLFPYELCIVDGTLKELDKIMENQKGKQKKAARLALALLEQKDIKVINGNNGHVDHDILAMAQPGHHIVATLDGDLKRKLNSKMIPIITMRQKKYLILSEV
jgi:rRNA-processing protein FCF1